MIDIIAQEPLLQLAAFLSVVSIVGGLGILFGVRWAVRRERR